MRLNLPADLSRQILIACSAVAFAAAAWAGEKLELVGVMTLSGDNYHFVFADESTGYRSSWIPLGSVIEGSYRVAVYDPKSETATLAKGGETRKISLNNSRVREGKPKTVHPELITGEIILSQGAVQNTQAILKLKIGESQRFDLGNGNTLEVKPIIDKDGNIQYKNIFEQKSKDGAAAPFREKFPTITALPGRPFSMNVRDVKIDFFPDP